MTTVGRTANGRRFMGALHSMTDFAVKCSISAGRQLWGVPNIHVKKKKVFFKRALAKMLRLAGDAHRQEFGK